MSSDSYYEIPSKRFKRPHQTSDMLQSSKIKQVRFNLFIGEGDFESDVPLRGLDAWNDTEKTAAINAANSLGNIIQNVTRGDDSQKQSDSLRASFSSYMELLGYLAESRLPERAGSLKARGIYLVILAGIAVLLGIVQLLALEFMASVGVITSGKENLTIVGRVINIFALCGVSFDALGAMFALWTSHSLYLTISKIDKIVLEKQRLSSKIHFTLDTFRQPDHTQQILIKNLVNLFADFQESSTKYHREARELVHLIDDHLPVQEDSIALAIIAFGLLFFFVSLFSSIISTQPLSVWASTTVAVAVTFIILRAYLGRQQPGFWRSITRRVRTVKNSITENSPLSIERERPSSPSSVFQPDEDFAAYV